MCMVTVKGKVIKGMLATLTILGYHHIFIMNDLFVYQTTHIVQRKSRLGTWLFGSLSNRTDRVR
ncbi:TPA: hypothetical protein ACHAVJ_002820 [Enterococcus faecium]